VGVNVAWLDVDGNPVEWFPSSEAVAWLLWAADIGSEDVRVVNLIDEYSDTELSPEEVAALADEVPRLLKVIPDDARRALVHDFGQFVRRAVGRGSLRFVGD